MAELFESMQDTALTVDRFLDHGATWHPTREIVSCDAAGTVTRTDYAGLRHSARRVSDALLAAGIAWRRPGGDAGMERRAAHGGVVRHDQYRCGAPHAEPATVPRPDRVDRRARGRPAAVRRSGAGDPRGAADPRRAVDRAGGVPVRVRGDAAGRLSRGFTTLKRVVIGGAAPPEALIRAFQDDYGVGVVQGWGMTETSPLATLSTPTAEVLAQPYDERVRRKGMQGRLQCGLEFRLVDDAGASLPHDGVTAGRLLIRGPTVTKGFFREAAEVLDADGFFDTGDVATIDAVGYMQITDRAKDIVKSGGEWISSIAIDNIATGHPAVAVAAVIGVPHPRWDERPVLLVQPSAGETCDTAEPLAFLDGKIARWWMPDDVLVVDAIPLGPTGKIDKKLLRQRLADYRLPGVAG